MNSESPIYIASNLILFQLLWFGCVVGAGSAGYSLAAIAAALPLVGLSFLSHCRTSDWQLAAICVGAGILLDNIWVQTDILAFPGHINAPFWIAVLWLGLGLTINHSMAWFRDRTVLGPLIVGGFAPVTYFTGEKLGAVAVTNPPALAFVSIAWCALFILLVQVARHSGDRRLQGATYR